MSFTIEATKFFALQLDELSENSLRLIEEKLKLIKNNPYRYKRIKGYNLILFRIRFKDKNKEKRLIYSIEKLNITLICILDRKKEYKDLKKYLSRN